LEIQWKLGNENWKFSSVHFPIHKVMPVVKMLKVALLAHKSNQEELLEFLQDQGVMEITPNDETEDVDHPKVQYEKAEIQFAIDFLRPSATKEILKAMKQRMSVEEVRRSAMSTDFRGIVDDCKKLEDQMGTVSAEKQALLGEESLLTIWKDLPFKLKHDEHETETTELLFGSTPAASQKVLMDGLKAELPRTDVLHVGDAIGQSLYAAIIWKADREVFEETVTKHGWTAVTLPEAERTPAQELKQIKQAFRVLEGKETEIARKRAELSRHLPDLARLAQFLHWMDEKQSVRSEFSQTEQTSMLTGWIPAKAFDDLSKKLEKKFKGVALLNAEPKEGEEPPMQIHNINALAPFEAVTRLYGLPSKGEMDPTRPLMLFFILYFGLCLTDAGYGLVLALLMGTAIWKFKIKRQDQKLIWLLFYAGIVTFFVSIPFGGWFGMTPDQLPASLTYTNANGDLRVLGQVWDLNKDVTFFQNLALSLGAIHLLFGIFLAGYWKLIHGKVFDAFATHFSVHFFVIALALKYVMHIPNMDYALIAIGLLFIWGQGSGKWYIRPLLGVLGTMNFLIGLMSNLLSYLRILALGLATGALAFAINQIAAVIGDLLPAFLGIPVFIAILFFGHMTSIALNSLGAFVHSGRLQFIEFFGQFFQGGGREFAPFRRTAHSIA
jgi:V/A-type H+-transporting ATPase subunit I